MARRLRPRVDPGRAELHNARTMLGYSLSLAGDERATMVADLDDRALYAVAADCARRPGIVYHGARVALRTLKKVSTDG